MPLGQATQKPVSVSYFSLVQPADMTACLQTILSINYHGMVQAQKDENGAVVWSIQIDSDTQHAVTANLNDVLVWDGSSLSVLRIEAFQDRYTVVS